MPMKSCLFSAGVKLDVDFFLLTLKSTRTQGDTVT